MDSYHVNKSYKYWVLLWVWVLYIHMLYVWFLDKSPRFDIKQTLKNFLNDFTRDGSMETFFPKRRGRWWNQQNKNKEFINILSQIPRLCSLDLGLTTSRFINPYRISLCVYTGKRYETGCRRSKISAMCWDPNSHAWSLR